MALTFGGNFLLLAVAWVSYVQFHIYDTFVALFTVQVLVPALISLTAAPELGGVFSLKRCLWWGFFFSIILGKGLWELERYLHRSGACPARVVDPLFWLHPAWHLLSATAHSLWMGYAASLHELRI